MYLNTVIQFYERLVGALNDFDRVGKCSANFIERDLRMGLLNMHPGVIGKRYFSSLIIFKLH